MQPLATTQLMMAWLSMCSADESRFPRQQAGHIAHTLSVLVLIVSSFIASVAYCLKYFSINFNSATFAFMVAIGDFGLIYFMIAAIQMRQEIDSIFTSLSTIYKDRK